MSAPDAAHAMRGAGLRVTKQRRAVLELLAQQPHSDAGWLTDAVRARVGAVSKQSVYNALADLSAAGLVRKVAGVSGATLWELQDDGHQHAICRACGAVADIDSSTVDVAASAMPGFDVEEVEVIVRGRCADCSRRHA